MWHAETPTYRLNQPSFSKGHFYQTPHKFHNRPTSTWNSSYAKLYLNSSCTILLNSPIAVLLILQNLGSVRLNCTTIVTERTRNSLISTTHVCSRRKPIHDTGIQAPQEMVDCLQFHLVLFMDTRAFQHLLPPSLPRSHLVV